MSNNESKRHHYIPKFLIKGFTDENNLLYIYDKKKDKILSKQRSPKSIFFENFRNTIKIDESNSNSIIEDLWFQKLDDELSKNVQKLQTEKLNTDLFNDDNIAQLQFFIINLFWRIPKTDFAAKDLIQRAELRTEGIDSETVRNDKNWNKILRTGLYKETIDQMRNSSTKPKNIYPKIAEFEKDIFVLGDFPFVFRNRLGKFTDLVEDDYFIALTSKRILSSSRKELQSFDFQMFLPYNAAIIEESQNYVVSNNLKILEGSVEYYRKLKKEHLIYFIKNRLFKEK
ncbi:DUF4238 domain-containing protein [Psychroserpens mesophilus]|uniref:DUF4238 domain-containing protein n=1 Tax=Psychroserpens mesophilus TaxID=325473 RepID=UPI00058D9BA0|nr:DUF4238 domain-containing protein [Psychroserpens mesophilus]